jgi:predicted HAD superfamily phosphohydrolase YqeG
VEENQKGSNSIASFCDRLFQPIMAQWIRSMKSMYTKKTILSLVFLLMLSFAGIAAASEIAIMSVGQSPDAMMVRVVLKKMKIDPQYVAMLKAKDLTDQKVLIAVIGGSSKGLGAAGVKKEQEMERAKDVFDTAKSKGIHILVMHVGGEGRRGELSDFFVYGAVPYGEKIIVVKSGNIDGLFDKLKSPEAPIFAVDKIQETQEPLANILKEWDITF